MISLKGKITRYGIDERDHVSFFLRKFYRSYASDAIEDASMSPSNMGRNWSCCLYRRDDKNYLVCFDSDDGSGGTPADCKLNWWKFREVLDKHDVFDYLIFKTQYASVSDQRQFYPFKLDVYPWSMMTNDPDRIFKIANSLPRVEKDIDVLFVGGRVHEHNRPFCWPKNRDISRWWPGNRKTGYEKLIDIRSRRHDLKIELHDGLVEPSKYYDLINRSKICVDFPGIGLSSRKFYEFMVLGKCVISLKQHIQSWPLEEWTHYASMGSDYLWNDLEQTIDFLLQNEEMRRKLETNAASLRPLMSHESVAQYVVKKIDDHISIRSGDPSIFEDLRPRYT